MSLESHGKNIDLIVDYWEQPLASHLLEPGPPPLGQADPKGASIGAPTRVLARHMEKVKGQRELSREKKPHMGVQIQGRHATVYPRRSQPLERLKQIFEEGPGGTGLALFKDRTT